MLAKNNLPRSKSLKSKVDIDRLLNAGQKISGDCFLVFWECADEFKYAVLAGKKLGNAVERNRIKRLFREAIRFNQDNLKKAVLLAILPNKGSCRAPFEKINAEISRIFDRINALA